VVGPPARTLVFPLTAQSDGDRSARRSGIGSRFQIEGGFMDKRVERLLRHARSLPPSWKASQVEGP